MHLWYVWSVTHLANLVHLISLSHPAWLLADAGADTGSWWHKMWEHILVPGAPWAEKAVRPILVYFFLIIGLRVAGKRELAQLNPFDLIVLLTLSNTVQNAIIGDDNSVSGGFVGATTLLAVNYLVVRTVRRSKRLQRLLEGRSDVLVWRGRVLDQHLDKELMSKADLAAAAHKQGIASLKDVERCVLEPTGTITFIEKKPTHESERHDELLGLLGQIRQDLAILQAERAERAARAEQPSPTVDGGGNPAGANGAGNDPDGATAAGEAAVRDLQGAAAAAERVAAEGGTNGSERRVDNRSDPASPDCPPRFGKDAGPKDRE